MNEQEQATVIYTFSFKWQYLMGMFKLTVLLMKYGITFSSWIQVKWPQSAKLSNLLKVF